MIIQIWIDKAYIFQLRKHAYGICAQQYYWNIRNPLSTKSIIWYGHQNVQISFNLEMGWRDYMHIFVAMLSWRGRPHLHDKACDLVIIYIVKIIINYVKIIVNIMKIIFNILMKIIIKIMKIIINIMKIIINIVGTS